ncbi:hypothetical protein GALMADRAFT_64579 [Galerina marginata CBS 339.88]|uniref:LysM domain-containing protein n=1 Tax=Galerina marginata (strain CBS 339.88) TaxID=685588 RepID=A0A067T6S2_GALM3|nr:hypothetical protein GALMADRAFT_64579 [Galerina marginata CBS 339.88]
MSSKQQPATFIDRNTTLCLACSSSLPPLKSSSGNLNVNSIFITNCCQRPICPLCIASNPRLARYDPCLACLGGVGIVSSGSTMTTGKGKAQISPGINTNSNANLDGAVRDEDTFVLGDDSDDDDDYEDGKGARSRRLVDAPAPPPPYEPLADVDLSTKGAGPTINSDKFASTSSFAVISPEEHKPPTPEGSDAPSEDLKSSMTQRTTPYKYYINKRDTLQGIALRFGLDGHEICKLNNLPPSVIRTTPHLLHTRAFLLLPPTAKLHASLALSKEEEKGREEKLVRERAEKRLQTLTKEVDWRVAKAYVALADDAGEQEAFDAKRKEIGSTLPVGASSGRSQGLEALAVQQYLDDEEWEVEERRAGRSVQTLNFPSKGDEGNHSKKGWW